jgi:uroporphyrin-III C-methyltransferase / precorrin-2 dehydrogenase / sirohydrochlorin ferrochelatase
MDYLPLFVDLRDRLVVVVGGGSVAARKVELLLRAHARVRIVSPALDPELALYRDAGRIDYRPVPFSAAQLDGASLAIAATDDEAVNAAVAEAARERGLWVNVVDDAQRSTVIFPAIVDRSPLVVAIGTEGSSPTLARRVRAQIEALLPSRLGDLARFAARWRHTVSRALPGLSERIRFWERALSGPAATRALAGDAAGADAAMTSALAAAHEPAQGGGEAYLIGAGPGDPDLLTLRAQQLLQQADVVLYDRLVSPAVLDRARRDALKLNVGKLPGHHEVTQAHINEQLLLHTRAGLRVARLKGGDPFIFGRGGEELQVLRDAGIPVTVVPGITAGLGAAAAAGIPLTHRGLAQSVTFVTATGAGAVDVDWTALARRNQTVVFYMSAAQVELIARQLLERGLPPDYPVALLERATWPDQRVLPTTIGALVECARSAQLKSPTLLIVGEVTSLAQLGVQTIEQVAAGSSGTGA